MSAFQSYAGAYKHEGGVYDWRCYATAPVYEIRCRDHAPFPAAPKGRKWASPAQQDHEIMVACLVDDAVEEFSQILLQVNPQLEEPVRTQGFRTTSAPAAGAAA